DLVANADATGAYLVDGLRALAGEHAAIGDVRGSGLFIGVDLVTDPDTREPASKLAHRLANGLREKGVLTNTIGKHANILKLRPPMPFSRENADTFLDIFAGQLTID
ncbi:MAG: aminotransferase class III-fold pyridoxal phosphate-dependent enzyme, partial [Gammaproteobacteria bacterium]|nr:aminotransferase class III-fold pyridoxal phosphate-dependent enzyme [Gammaproteobacteria bacterium]